MKKTIALIALFAALCLALWGLSDSAVRAGRDLLPESWTAGGPGEKTVSLNLYGVDRFLRQSLFGPVSRRWMFLGLAAFFAVTGLVAIRALTGESRLETEPRWRWADLFWVFGAVMVFWECGAGPAEDSTGRLFLKDAAIGVWICALAAARGIGARAMGLSARDLMSAVARGVAASLLLIPTLAFLSLIALASAGPPGVVSDVRLPVPSSVAAAWLAALVLPFFEEMLFRGFLYRHLRARWPEVLANVGTSLIFAAIHGVAGSVGLARFVGSLLMCRLYEHSGSLWSPLAAHATFNAILLVGPKLL